MCCKIIRDNENTQASLENLLQAIKNTSKVLLGKHKKKSKKNKEKKEKRKREKEKDSWKKVKECLRKIILKVFSWNTVLPSTTIVLRYELLLLFVLQFYLLSFSLSLSSFFSFLQTLTLFSFFLYLTSILEQRILQNLENTKLGSQMFANGSFWILSKLSFLPSFRFSFCLPSFHTANLNSWSFNFFLFLTFKFLLPPTFSCSVFYFHIFWMKTKNWRKNTKSLKYYKKIGRIYKIIFDSLEDFKRQKKYWIEKWKEKGERNSNNISCLVKNIASLNQTIIPGVIFHSISL